jgi:hypothetical protein
MFVFILNSALDLVQLFTCRPPKRILDANAGLTVEVRSVLAQGPIAGTNGRQLRHDASTSQVGA